MTEHEPRVWSHLIREHRNESERGAQWRYWRGFLDIRRAGLFRWGNGQRADLRFALDVLLVPKHGHGIGAEVTVGDDGDLKLFVSAGKAGAVWVKIGGLFPRKITPKTEMVTGIRFHLNDSTGIHPVLRWQVWHEAHRWTSGTPRWRDGHINGTTILGRTRGSGVKDDPIHRVVPMPEGTYPCTLTRTRYESRYVRFPGTMLDRIHGPRTHTSWWCRIEGGIPVQGKGENSYDCGMDGIFGTGGNTPQDAIANVVRAALRDRARYGGPHHLPHPMTVIEAEQANA